MRIPTTARAATTEADEMRKYFERHIALTAVTACGLLAEAAILIAKQVGI